MIENRNRVATVHCDTGHEWLQACWSGQGPGRIWLMRRFTVELRIS